MVGVNPNRVVIATQSEINLLLEFGGRLRGESEMRRLLAAVRPETTRVLSAEGRLRIVEARAR